MHGSLNEVLSRPLTPEDEKILEAKIRTKMAGGIRLFVKAVRFLEREYGKEAVEKLKQEILREVRPSAQRAAKDRKDRSLRAFCRELEAGCCGTHVWEKLEDTETRQSYRFTCCGWAEIFRSLDAGDIGFWICEGDGPAAEGFNPDIRFERTRTLMEGHDCCDHQYFTK